MKRPKRKASAKERVRVIGHDSDVLTVCFPGGFVQSMANPDRDTHLIWKLTWANTDVLRQERLSAASIIGSFDYLLSDAIPLTEAMRRIRIMRNARLPKGARNNQRGRDERLR